jgi:hypothetical protein
MTDALDVWINKLLQQLVEVLDNQRTSSEDLYFAVQWSTRPPCPDCLITWNCYTTVVTNRNSRATSGEVVRAVCCRVRLQGLSRT